MAMEEIRMARMSKEEQARREGMHMPKVCKRAEKVSVWIRDRQEFLYKS